MHSFLYQTSFIEWILISIPLIPIFYVVIKIQNYALRLEDSFFKFLLQIFEFGMIILLFPYSLFVFFIPFSWLYGFVGWFAIILFPFIYGFPLVWISEFYIKRKKNKS